MLISTRLILFPYYLLFVVGLLLPSDGSHGILTPKSLVFISASLGVSAVILIRKKIRRSHLPLGIILSFYLAFLALWLLIGIANPLTLASSAVDQTKLFLITLSVPLMTAYLHYEKLIDLRYLLRLIIFSNFIYCGFKLVIIFLHLTGIIDMWTLIQFTGFRRMSMAIFGGLQRLQTSVDVSTPFVFMFALFSDRLDLKIKPHTRKLYLLTAVISNLFTFSRFLLFIQLAAFCFYFLTLDIKRMQKAISMALMVLILAVIAIGPHNIYQSIEQRFFSRSNYLSDRARVEQIEGLFDHYVHSPYVGAGMGAHAPTVIRDRTQVHSYEVQWMAFLMQFGILGVLFLVLTLFTIAYPLLRPPAMRSKLAFLMLYVLWIVSGFTNPFLISLQSGIVYTLFLSAGWLLPRSLAAKI